MYTRCPKCETCFRVTDRHLAIAKGKVRCGKCQLVFNAPENAIDDLPGNSAETQAQTSNNAHSITPPPAKPEVKTEELSPAAKLKMARLEAEKEREREKEKRRLASAASSTVDVKPSTPKTEETVHTKTTSVKQEVTKTPVKEAEVKQQKKTPVPPPKVAPPLYKTETTQPASSATTVNTNPDHHDAFHIEDDSFDDDFDLDAAINELTHAAEEVTYDYDRTAIIEEPAKLKTETATKQEPQQKQAEETKGDDVFSTDAYDATNANSVADILDDVKGQLSLDIETPGKADSSHYNADDEFQFIELDEEPAAAKKDKLEEESNDEFLKNNFDLDAYNDESEENINKDDLDDFDLDDGLDALDQEPVIDSAAQANKTSDENSAEDFIDQFEALDTPTANAKEEIIIADPDANDDPEIKIGEHSDGYEVPYQLRKDVDRLNAAPGRGLHPALKVSLVVLLLVLSFSQLAYFRAHELVSIIPGSRSMLESFCENLGCQYSGPSDTKQIELVSRDVRLHPKENNALLISAAMVNNAFFAQPYPDIHIRLSDISGNVVAERVFNPKTYMGKLSNPFLLMRSKTPVHINFEVVDPGKDAVNFEFTFL